MKHRKANGWEQARDRKRDGVIGADVPRCEFDELLTEFGLSEEFAVYDKRIERWVRRYYEKRFVPEAVLEFFGLAVEEVQRSSFAQRRYGSTGARPAHL